MKSELKFSVRKVEEIDCIPPMVQHYYSQGGFLKMTFFANAVGDNRTLESKLSRDEAFNLAMNLLQGVAYLDQKVK